MDNELSEIKKRCADNNMKRYEHISYYILAGEAPLPEPDNFEYCKFLYKLGGGGNNLKESNKAD